MRRYGLLLISTLMVLMMISFPLMTAMAASRTFTVGLVPKALISPFWITLVDMAEEAAQEKGINVVVTSPPNETAVAEQINMIEDLIERKVDLLAIGACSPVAIIPVVKKALAAGIPVVMLDTQTPLPEVEVTSLIGSDNIAGGRIAGEYAVQLLEGKGRIAMIEGAPGHQSNEDRKQGFNEVVGKHSGIEIVASQPANWERAMGMTVMENILQAHPHIDLVFAACDEMALGALKAIAAAGKKIPVLSYDGNEEALIAVRDGRLQSTVSQRPDMMGKMIITEVVEKLLKGEPIPEKLPAPLANVTRENVSDFLE